MHNFDLICCDTDAITIVKKNGAAFSEEETDKLTKELNSLFPEEINWEFEFNVPKMVIFKAKNYIIWDGKKIKVKGSALKSSKIEPALKEFNDNIINCIINSRTDEIDNIYKRYVLEIKNGVKDIKRWASKKTLTDKIWTSDRTNETKILDAIQGSNYKEADKVYVYFKEDGNLALAENFDGSYNKDKLYEKLFKTMNFYSEVLNKKQINYKLKGSKRFLEELK